jgi:hypothetical protein
MKISTIIAEAQEERIFREYLEMYEIVRSRTVKLSTLTEAKIQKLGTTELHNIFFNIEKAMTAGNQNKNLLGKGADLLGKAGAGIGKIGQAAADSAIGKGLDKVYRDAKQKITTAMGKTETGAKVLRKIDHYKQLAKKYPHLNDAVTKATSILAGAASGGATGVAIGAAIKAADAAVKGGELTDVAGSAIKGGALAAAGAAAVKAPGAIGNLVDQGVDAYNNLDLNPFDNDVPQVNPSVVDPNAPPVSDVYPDEADRGVKPGADTPAPGPENVNPPPKPVPPKPVPVKPALVPDVTTGGGPAPTGSEVPNVNSTAYLDAAKQNIISQNMAAQNAGVPGADMMAQDTVTQPVAPRNITEAFRALDFKVVALPLSIMVDKESTVRRWALNESLGRPRGRDVQLTEDGVNTVFYNVDKFYRKLEEARRNNYGRELRNQVGQAAARTGITGQQFARDNPAAFKAMQTGTANPPRKGYVSTNLTPDQMDANQEGGTVRNRPANANDPVAMAKNAPSANTSSTAGPMGSLPGGPAPAGNKMPYLAADPEGKFKTTYSGEVGNEFLTKAEKGLGRFKGYMGDLFKSASTKFDANQAKARFASSGSATDSDSVAQWLTTQKVPADVITQVYQQLKLPAPNLQAAGDAADGPNRHQMIKGLGGKPDVSRLYEPEKADAADATADATADAGAAKGQKAGAAATGTDASAIAQQSGAAPQQQKVAREIDAEIDDLIRALRKTDNILQPAYVKYIRDALDKTFGPATAAAPAAAPAAPAEVPTASSGGTGGGIAPVTTSAPAAVPKTGTNNEGRRAKGRYIKETRAQKLARQFEAYVMGQA